MDLASTLIRAQALFRRFQRTVEAIDRKNSFPAAPVRQRKPVSDSANANKSPTSASTSTGITTSSDVPARPPTQSTQDATPSNSKQKDTSSKSSSPTTDTPPSSPSKASQEPPIRPKVPLSNASKTRKNSSSANAGLSSNRPSDPPQKKEPVISPELRKLLSRKVDKMEKREVTAHGGGVGS